MTASPASPADTRQLTILLIFTVLAITAPFAVLGYALVSAPDALE